MNVESAQVLKLALQLFSLLDAWATAQDRSCTFLDSAINIQAQRDDTLPFLLPQTSDSFSTLPKVLNPHTTPSIVFAFPDLVPRLVAKQTAAIHSVLHKFYSEIYAFEKVQESLSTLQSKTLSMVENLDQKSRDAVESGGPLFKPQDVTLVELAVWLDTIALQYRREYAAKVEIIETCNGRPGDSRPSTDGPVNGNMTRQDSKAEQFDQNSPDWRTLRVRWGLQPLIDFTLENQIRERVADMQAVTSISRS
ncbi:hypothetical protein DFS34DRAFT_588708 [Phlyctochytrium arcticum]|nr:hypothetical protein DFS34DRAFT_588708 [Phlyctochytrium arcticum]